MELDQTDLPDERLTPVAILVASPEDLEGKLGLSFKHGRDDRGPYVWAAVTYEDQPYVFVQHKGGAEEGTTLWARESADPLAIDFDLVDRWRPGAWEVPA